MITFRAKCNRSTSITLLTCSLAVALVGCRGTTPESIADDLLRSVQSKDSGPLTRHVDQEELDLCGLTREQWRNAVEKLVLPNLAGFEPIGPPTVKQIGGGPSKDVIYHLRHKDGREIEIGLTIMNTPNGFRLTSGMRPLLMSSLAAAHVKPGVPHPTGNDKKRFWRTTLQDALPELNQLGLKGYVNTSPQNGVKTFVPWERIINDAPK